MNDQTLIKPVTVDRLLDRIEEFLDENSDPGNRIGLSLYIPKSPFSNEDESMITNAQNRARIAMKEAGCADDEIGGQIERNLGRFLASRMVEDTTVLKVLECLEDKRCALNFVIKGKKTR